jgi:hypothetical protein
MSLKTDALNQNALKNLNCLSETFRVMFKVLKLLTKYKSHLFFIHLSFQMKNIDSVNL